jgi:hypothetical protein
MLGCVLSVTVNNPGKKVTGTIAGGSVMLLRASCGVGEDVKVNGVVVPTGDNTCTKILNNTEPLGMDVPLRESLVTHSKPSDPFAACVKLKSLTLNCRPGKKPPTEINDALAGSQLTEKERAYNESKFCAVTGIAICWLQSGVTVPN